MIPKKAHLSMPAKLRVVPLPLLHRMEGLGAQPRHEFQLEDDVVMPLRGFAGGLESEGAIIASDVGQLLGTVNRECLGTIFGFVRRAVSGNEEAENAVEFFAKVLAGMLKKGD
jgi:hypothetical protein